MVTVELTLNGQRYGSVGGSPLTLVALRWSREGSEDSAPLLTVCGIGDSGEEWPGPEIELRRGDRLGVRVIEPRVPVGPPPELDLSDLTVGREEFADHEEGTISLGLGDEGGPWLLADVGREGSLTALLTIEGSTAGRGVSLGLVGLRPVAAHRHELWEWPTRELETGESLVLTVGAKGEPTPPARRVRDAVRFALGLQRQEYEARRRRAAS